MPEPEQPEEFDQPEELDTPKPATDDDRFWTNSPHAPSSPFIKPWRS
jgi:hypothetical protein